MAADSGEEAERDPVQKYIDEAFDEMMRGLKTSNRTAVKSDQDLLLAHLVESAVAALSKPASSRESELEKVILAQSLATALADSLAPALAEAIAAEIMKGLVPGKGVDARNESQSAAGSRSQGNTADGPREPEDT